MNWWFGRKSAVPGVRAYAPDWLRGDEGGAGFARGYSAQYDEVFHTNPVGQRCVRLVAGMVGGLTIDATAGQEEAARLVMRDGLLEEVAAALLLHGNAYVQLIADGHDRPAELHALRPERVSVATDAAGCRGCGGFRGPHPSAAKGGSLP